jgi:outer membrane biosynthesis protein TonB
MKRQLMSIGVAALVLMLSGCPFKKKQPPVPQQAQASTVQPEPTPAPPAPQPAETQPVPAPAETQPEKTETTAEKPKPKKKPSAKKPAAPATSAQGQQQSQTPASTPTETSKLVIQEGPAPNSQGQLSAGAGLEDSSARSKQTTEQLLQSAQANLNSINRPLSPEEQAMVAQIKDYMAQSRKATKDSDTVRAHNLALKARLLSDELVKH